MRCVSLNAIFSFALIFGTATFSRLNAATCLAPPTNLVSWWRAETNLLDSWDSNNGSPYIGPTYAAGRIGFAFSNSVVVVPDSASLHFTTGFTVHAWVNGSTFTNLNPYTIVSKYETPFSSIIATQSSFYLGLTNNGHLFFMVTPNGLARTNVSITATQALVPGQWYFVAATYDHTHIRLYLNGQLFISRDFFSGIFPGTTPLSIGGIASPNSGLTNASFQFGGLIDEVAVYNRALSSAEIESVYNADGAGLCLTGPTIIGPQNLAVPLNEDAVFSVSVVGNRPLTYQWRFNGTNLAGATASSLYLERVQSNRIGNYSIAVTNQVGGAISTNARLTLLPPLPCVAPPPGIISWWPADRSLIDAVGTNNGREDLIVFPPINGATYATGKVGSAFASSITVPNSASLNFGSNADFSFEGWIKSAPTNPVILFRNTTNEIFVEKFAGSAGYILSLLNGQFALQVGGGFSLPLTSQIFVASGPDMRDGHWHHVACTISRSVTNGSHLYVDGANALSFDLSRLRGSLSNVSELFLGFSTRQFLGFVTNNSLLDELTLYNRGLDSNEIASIYYAGSGGKCKNPPVIVTDPSSQAVNETSNATFTVIASGLGPHYQWRFNGTNLAGATASSLTLTNVSIASAGSYAVRITNGFGVVTSAVATLTVHRFPVAVCTNMVVSAGTTCTGSASIDDGSFAPDGGPVSIGQSPASPYPLGTNAVTLTVTDTNGLSASCNALVIVVDTTAPTITCPADKIVEFINEAGAPVEFNVHASDNCSGIAPVLSIPASGSVFPIGVTIVNNTATDAAGNAASCTFQVTVLGAQGVLSNVLTDLTYLRLTITRRPDAEALDKVVQNLSDSLDATLWLDQTHITRSHGELVFNKDKAAVQELAHLLKQKQSSVDSTVLLTAINRILKSDRLLAAVAIADALAGGADASSLARATDELAQGDFDVGDGQFESGISHYRNAWKNAMQQTLKLSIRLAGNQTLLEVNASPGDTFIIETSTNLLDWTELDTVPADS
ncbi:MAG TPA: LamG-like jellyroll fold domain-containing protein, partial [Candidatus Dormibacteraeota bacterium]|nr:LamG-like jellyroll fold domain-containing protein [Candidatus Dormibacteraeota bacterium]